MKEILEKLVASELLSEESKTEILTAVSEAVQTAVEEARQIAIAEAKVEFAAKYAEDKQALVEAVETLVTQKLQEEMTELKDDVNSFRDLEVEFNTKLIEEKEALALQARADIAQLVEMVDEFLDQRVAVEMEELKESIEEAKKVKFGIDLYEAYQKVFAEKFADTNDIAKKLDESTKTIAALKSQLSEKDEAVNKMIRKDKLAAVLEDLQGRPREIMEAVLKSVPTDKLEETYTKYIGRVLQDTVTNAVESEKESEPSQVLAEEVTPIETKVVVKTGDSVDAVVEKPAPKALNESARIRLAQLAGLSN